MVQCVNVLDIYGLNQVVIGYVVIVGRWQYLDNYYDKNGCGSFKGMSYQDYYDAGGSNWHCLTCNAEIDCNVKPMAQHLLKKHHIKVRFKGHDESEY